MQCTPGTGWTLTGINIISAYHLEVAIMWCAVARVVLHQQYRTSSLSSNELLKQLHWLPIEWRIRFKLATLTFKALHTGRPPYLSDLLHYHEPMRSLRSSSSHQLSVSRHNLSFGSRAFRFSAPRLTQSLEFITCQHPRVSLASYF